MNTTCKCHGVSGSCSTKTCWRQLAPFQTIGNKLKDKYKKSLKVVAHTNHAAPGKPQLVKIAKNSNSGTRKNYLPPRRGDLIYIDESPNFCRKSKYSPGTYGRICTKSNCDVMCCGRGYNIRTTEVKRRCQCQVKWCCTVHCKQCTSLEEIYMCK